MLRLAGGYPIRYIQKWLARLKSKRFHGVSLELAVLLNNLARKKDRYEDYD